MPLSDLWKAADEPPELCESASDSVADSDPSDSDDDDDDDDPKPTEDLAGGIKRRLQTEKARTASLLAKQAKRMEEHVTPQQTAAEFFQEKCFTPGWKHYFDSTFHSFRIQKRAVRSYLLAMVAAINSALDQSQGQFEYMMTTNVVDDVSLVVSTNTVRDMTNTVRTVMHNYQQVILARYTGDCLRHKSFLLHRPSIYLNSAKYKDMCAGFMSWLLSSAHDGVGQHLISLGLDSSLLRLIRLTLTVFIGDALKTNDSLFHELRCQTVLANLRDVAKKHAALRVKCLLHQSCLIRRPLALCFDGFWSTQVRLGHLFESCSFKLAFNDSLVAVVEDLFDFLLVGAVPDSCQLHRSRAIRSLRSLGS
jgi:hypothetical protein